MNNDDLYGILGVACTATTAEIKEQFRFLSHAYHPDKFATQKQRKVAEEHFKKINEAYRILSDPASRARYDASRAGSSDPSIEQRE
jgi:DnaJ-class molecular chaperone with C-terminal Zn finger domain